MSFDDVGEVLAWVGDHGGLPSCSLPIGLTMSLLGEISSTRTDPPFTIPFLLAHDFGQRDEDRPSAHLENLPGVHEIYRALYIIYRLS